MATDGKVLRCAIYTRKSTEHGLEQEFNSLDAQREACEATKDGGPCPSTITTRHTLAVTSTVLP